jgi:hypothetical protein
MNRIKTWLYLVMAVCGAASIYLGATVFTGEAVKQISGLCFGVGAALAALGLGGLIDGRIVSSAGGIELARRKNIEVNDERNTLIRDKVGARINQVVIYALSIIVLAMGLMQVNLAAIIMVASVFLLEAVLAITLTGSYSKRL